MSYEYHLKYFSHVFLGLQYIPDWLSDGKYWQVSQAVAKLIDIRSAIWYGAATQEDYKEQKRKILKFFSMPPETLHILVGIASSDLSSPFYTLQSFFQQSDLKVRRQRVTVTEPEPEW